MIDDHDGMRVLFLDIETAPHKVYAWGLFKENIYLDRVIEPGYTLCFAARWEHDETMHFYSLFTHTMEEMLQAMYDLLDECDVVVHYNGKRFDMPTLNKEFILNGFVPPTNYKQIDLYQVVRSTFRFVSNKLDFVAQALGLGGKVAHKGMELWRDCMEGVEAGWGERVSEQVLESWDTMQEYNEEDVSLLVRLYYKLQPWIRVHPNRALYLKDPNVRACPKCGSENLVKRGIERPATVNAYQRYKCNDCGANSRSRVAVKKQIKPEVVG